MRRGRKGETVRIVLHKGEKGCEVCGADLAGRMTWTRFCDPCMAERTRVRGAEKVRVRYRERRERGVCVKCGKVPAFRGGLCEPHWEGNREYARKAKAKRRRRDRKFVNCEICGVLIRQTGNVKYCRPCSVDRNGPWHQRRRFARRKERGLCEMCGKVPAREGLTHCAECSSKKVGALMRIYNERKREGLCTQCGKVPKGKTALRCEECRRDRKLKNIRREMRK